MTDMEREEELERRQQYQQCAEDLYHVHHTTPSVLETILYMNVVNGEGQQDITALINTLAEIRRSRS